jgi:hypothetical protein
MLQQALRTSRACTGSNVRDLLSRCKQKAAWFCAEAVEDRNFLWKEKEKQKQIGHGFSRINRD